MPSQRESSLITLSLQPMDVQILAIGGLGPAAREWGLNGACLSPLLNGCARHRVHTPPARVCRIGRAICRAFRDVRKPVLYTENQCAELVVGSGIGPVGRYSAGWSVQNATSCRAA